MIFFLFFMLKYQKNVVFLFFMLKYQKNVVKIKWFRHYSSSKADFVKVSIVFTT